MTIEEVVERMDRATMIALILRMIDQSKIFKEQFLVMLNEEIYND